MKWGLRGLWAAPGSIYQGRGVCGHQWQEVPESPFSFYFTFLKHWTQKLGSSMKNAGSASSCCGFPRGKKAKYFFGIKNLPLPNLTLLVQFDDNHVSFDLIATEGKTGCFVSLSCKGVAPCWRRMGRGWGREGYARHHQHHPVTFPPRNRQALLRDRGSQGRLTTY